MGFGKADVMVAVNRNDWNHGIMTTGSENGELGVATGIKMLVKPGKTLWHFKLFVL